MAEKIMPYWGYQAILILAPIATPKVIPEQILHQHSTLASAINVCKVRLADRKNATGYSMQCNEVSS
jgi:hypothetical protein